MLRGLLRDSEAAKALFEKTGLFKSPELLERYVIASEVTVEVLDLFLSRILGTERGSVGNGSDLKDLWEDLGYVSLRNQNGVAGEDLSARAGEPVSGMEELHGKVHDLERQLCAMQRQLQMQWDVSQRVASLDGRLNEIVRECESRVSDVKLQISSVSEDVARLEKEVSIRARIGDVKELSDDVSRLKEGERKLGDRISDVEKKAEAKLRNEIQGEVMKRESAKTVQEHGKKILCDNSRPLEGIIAHLTRKCSGNVHEKGVVEVTASSCYASANSMPKNVVELGTKSWFASEDKPNSWICYDFKDQRVAPTSYSIVTAGSPYPISWALEVSNDGTTWQVTDHRDNNFDLSASFITRNFVISTPPRGSFRFIRLRLTGKNQRGDDHLNISSLELFGALSFQ